MNRNECEERLLILFQAMLDIYDLYNPEGGYLTAFRTADGSIVINNLHYGDDKNSPVMIYQSAFKAVFVKH